MLPIRHDRFRPDTRLLSLGMLCFMPWQIATADSPQSRSFSAPAQRGPQRAPPGQPTSTATARACEACFSTCFIENCPGEVSGEHSTGFDKLFAAKENDLEAYREHVARFGYFPRRFKAKDRWITGRSGQPRSPGC